MNLSIVPWWAWLIGGLIAFFLGVGVCSLSEGQHDELGIFIGRLVSLAGVVSCLVGIIRFIKWVWSW
jgi:hypothetical protein